MSGALRRALLELTALVPEHRREQLPGGSGSFAPGGGDGEKAIRLRVRVVVEEAGVAGEQSLIFVRGGVTGFDESALGGHFGDLDQISGRDEVELIRIAEPDAAFERMLQFAQEIRARRFDFVADAAHAGVGIGIQREAIEALERGAAESGADAEFAQEGPLLGGGVEGAFDDVQERSGGIHIQ